MDKNKTAHYGDVIKFSYTGMLSDGRIFDSSENPISAKIGTKENIDGLGSALLGMQVGEEKNIEIPPQDGYGPVDPYLIVRIPHKLFDKYDYEPRLGMTIETSRGECIVSRLDEDSVDLDFNHPLAGETLFFKLKVDKITEGK